MRYVRKFSDERPYRPSEEVRQKISRTLKEKYREGIIKSNGNKGYAWSQVQKDNLKAVRRGQKKIRYWKGKKLPLETRQKMSLAKRKYDRSDSEQPIDAIGYRSWCSNTRNRVIKRLRKESSTHTFKEWEKLKDRYNLTCPCCKKMEPEIKLTEDHIIPLSQGGTDLIENIQPLCRKCNFRKHTKIVKY